MANGHGGRREGSGRKRGSTRRSRFFLKTVEGELGMLDLLPEALACLKRQMALGDTTAAQTVIRFCLIPPEKRDDLVTLLLRDRLTDDTGDGDADEA